MILLLLIFALFLIYLLCERIALNRYREKIPLRICVTGTRGKSSLVRLLASILRENGGAVLAKTTGSESRFILPDGSETEVPRRGIPSIIEQKSLLKKAVELKATSLVAEVMSIHPENHYVESQQIIQPNYVVITNVRADHIEAMGDTKDSIAEVFTADIPRHSQVYLIKAENKDCFIGRAKEADAELHTIASGFSEQFVEKAPQLKEFFSDTLDLVCGLAESLKIDTETIIRGLLNTKLDEGSSKTWRLPLLKDKRYIFCVNGFSANDPESTALLVEKIQNELGAEPERFVGLLHLRADRGDRTLQWIETLKSGCFAGFKQLYYIGSHGAIVKRKLGRGKVLREKSPEALLDALLPELAEDDVLFGFGNYRGLGRQLVAHWRSLGSDHGL